MLEKIYTFLNKYDKYLYTSLTLLYLLPIFLSSHFYTVDGPSHLYNSLIINNILIKDEFWSTIFKLNPIINPNWIGHLFLSSFLFLFSPTVSEKLLNILYVIGLSHSFYYCLKNLHSNNFISKYFIFSLIYSFLYLFGFYNFQIGIIILLYIIGFYNKKKTYLSNKDIIIITLLCTISFFSHLFIIAIIIGYLLFDQLFFTINKNYYIITGSFVFILFIGYYLISGPSTATTAKPNFYSFNELVKNLYGLYPSRGLEYAKAGIFTKWIIGSYLLLLFTSFFNTQNNFKKNPWFWISIISLLFYFVLPHSYGEAIGFISERINYLFLFFLATFLSTLIIRKDIEIIIFLILLYMNVSLMLLTDKSNKKINLEFTKIEDVTKIIPLNSTLLPLSFKEDSRFDHISNYIGINKESIILENYEASLGHFPLVWNSEKLPNYSLLSNKDSVCFEWPRNTKNRHEQISYVLILLENKNQTIPNCIKKQLEENYFLDHKSSNDLIQLYKVMK